MKFAQYLQETQTPEWKRAYVDYRGLKKRITAIRRVQEGAVIHESPSASRVSIDHNVPRSSDARSEDEDHARSSLSVIPLGEPRLEQVAGPVPSGSSLTRRRPSRWGRRSSVVQDFQQRISSVKSSKGRAFSGRLSISRSRPTNPVANLPLNELLPLLSPQEVAFFTYLDAQVEKVESFYSNREKELSLRTQLLEVQLRELQDHRRLIHRKADQGTPWMSVVATALKLKLLSHPVIEVPGRHSHPSGGEVQGMSLGGSSVTPDDQGIRNSVRTSPPSAHTIPNEKDESSSTYDYDTGRHGIPLSSDPDDYLHAKKKLKKAVLEHYRVLELLHNYRILNLTGFRKALKKFEKVTKIRVQEQYMTEKIDKSLLASDAALQSGMKEMQELYAQAFFRGDAKKAMNRLRGGLRSKTHHFSTFRSGILTGTAIPALVSGIYCSCLRQTREEIQAWDALLYIYSVIFVPVVFSMLIGMNLLVWARSRVNYTFIFELGVRTRLDYREYYEIPSFLFATLCYAFWLSFARIGLPHVSPTIWPLVWLGLTAVTILNPLPFLFRPSRYWLLRNVGRLFLSGTRRVEFADFWIGDQFCSLIFTLSNLYFFVCVYAEHFPPDWHTCGTRSSHWPIAFSLASLPLLIRLVQSIKRYADSGLVTHLINGGKYGSGIVNYLFYFLWRQQETHYNPLFALWLIFTTIYSVYATSWDLLMDWSLLRPHAKKFFLRDELGYSDHVYLYYIAIVTNVLLRFAWAFYIPERGPSIPVRSFVVGVLEILRRVQWNFYRLENEHLGNIDQYRVTREVPLPYAFDSGHNGDRDDGDDSEPCTPPSHDNN